ncbi:MAG: CHAT domain-containing protein [Bacteroidia bacterium]
MYPLIASADPGDIEKAWQYRKKCREKAFTPSKNNQADSTQYWVYEGLHYFKRNNINDALLLGKLYNDIAFVERKLNHTWTSITFADSAILSLETLDTLTQDMLFAYRLKGQMYQRTGDFFRANIALNMARYITDSLHTQEGRVLNDLGGIQVHFGQLDQAEKYFTSAVEYEKDAEQRAICLANLTDVYLNKGALKQAKRTWEKVEQYIKNGDIKDYNLPHLLQAKAHLYKREGDHLRSIKTLKEAISLLEELDFSQRDVEKIRCDLVELLLEEHPLEAGVEIRKAYRYFRARENELQEPFKMVTPHLMAQAFYRQYRASNAINLLDSCLYYCKKAQEAADILRQHFFYRNSKYQLAKYLKANASLGIDVAYTLIKEGNVEKGQALLYYFMEKGRNQVLLDELVEKQQAYLQANGLLDKVYDLELQQLNTVDSLERIDLLLQIERLKSQYKSNENSRYSLPHFSNPDLSQLIHLSRQSNAVFLEFGEGQNHSYALIVDDGHVRHYQIAVSNDSLKLLLEKHLWNLNSPNISAEDYAHTAYALYDLLLAPLAIEKQNVVVIPSESVASLPFASLVRSPSASKGYKQLDYALNTWSFSYHFSTTFLTAIPTEAKQSFCALLPLNQAEGDLFLHEDLLYEVTDQLHGTYFQKDDQCSLPLVTKHHDFIHISSHGIFSKESPAKSFLYMPGSDSSKLSIEQLYSTTMSSSPFVVLNACETGKGEVRSGEGIDNFTRAFFYSGALGIIESSWKINATQTAGIFEDFYHALSNGADTKRSLRQAQQRYLENQDTDNHFAHPYYWSGFKHFGTAVTLKKPASVFSYWLIFGLSLVAIVFIWGVIKRKAK